MPVILKLMPWEASMWPSGLSCKDFRLTLASIDSIGVFIPHLNNDEINVNASHCTVALLLYRNIRWFI